jgi:8-oxo-dGTP diphosphatase
MIYKHVTIVEVISIKIRPSIILIEDESILLMRYSYGGSDVWGIPGGGVNDGETVPDTLKRELGEELGVSIEIGDLVCLVETPAAEKVKHTLHCVFRGLITKGEPQINPNETTAIDIEWIKIDDIKNRILYPPINDTVANLNEPDFKCSYLGLSSRTWL